MIDRKPYRLYVVVDPHYGEMLRDLPADEPIWVIDSEENRPVIHDLWKKHKLLGHQEGITSFKYDIEHDPENWFIAEMATIDLHHGEYSHDPPYTVLEAIGVAWSGKIANALKEYGFIKYEKTIKGFITHRNPPSVL